MPVGRNDIRSVDDELLQEAEGLAAKARRRLHADINKRRRLIANMRGDLVKHGDPEEWKRIGDLILANLSTAARHGDVIKLLDYFDENTPEIEVEGDRNSSLNEIAEAYFRKYAKARNAIRIVDERIADAETKLEAAIASETHIDKAFAAADIASLTRLAGIKPPPKPVSKKKRPVAEFRGARCFVSSDGIEILVGKKAVDNDFLTFRVARSTDTWMHAADYPGSHVVVRNKNREETPHRTLVEAAELAAFYSDARGLPKAAVNYTLKKNVNKPKRASHGLVSLARFRTVLVEPKVGVELKPE
jgi:predicted ribosome quality control (RQC) complex YloA/Tae2 family protein